MASDRGQSCLCRPYRTAGAKIKGSKLGHDMPGDDNILCLNPTLTNAALGPRITPMLLYFPKLPLTLAGEFINVITKGVEGCSGDILTSDVP